MFFTIMFSFTVWNNTFSFFLIFFKVLSLPDLIVLNHEAVNHCCNFFLSFFFFFLYRKPWHVFYWKRKMEKLYIHDTDAIIKEARHFYKNLYASRQWNCEFWIRSLINAPTLSVGESNNLEGLITKQEVLSALSAWSMTNILVPMVTQLSFSRSFLWI